MQHCITDMRVYDEIKKCSNGFSESNEIGSGGYGKVKKKIFKPLVNMFELCFKLLFCDYFCFLQVYRGMLSDGQVIAIKKAQQGSMQGGLEFKTEIELLSLVHNKNLFGLVGFCFVQGEQMLCLMELLGKACQVISLCSI